MSLGIPLGWSARYSGVESRHKITDECNGVMGARAAENALAKAQMTLADIDMIISASASIDHLLPNQASLIKHEMKDGHNFDVPTIEIDSTCLSFVAALDISARILNGKDIKNILIVSSEVSSGFLDPNNWETSTLFGDAAAAAIVGYDEGGKSYYMKGSQKTYSDGTYLAIIEGGVVKKPIKYYPYDPVLHSFKMEGKKLPTNG